MVRKIKKKKIKGETFEELNFFDEFLSEENFIKTEEDEEFERILEEQEAQAEKFYSSVPLTLDAIEEIMEKAEKLPSGKVKKIEIGDEYKKEFMFLLLCMDGIFDIDRERGPEINLENDYMNYEKDMRKNFLAKYNIDSALELNKVILHFLNNGAVETWKKYIEAESLKKALEIPEIKMNKKAKERKYEFIKKFKDKVPEDILLGWSLKEALILARCGDCFEYSSKEETDRTIKLIFTKLIKNYKTWKDYGISCLIGELLEKYQNGKKKIAYGELYYEISCLEELLSEEDEGEWIENPWMQL